MNRILFIVLAFALSFCTNDKTTRQADGDASAQNTARETIEQPAIVNGIAQEITLYANDMEATPGDQICVDVLAKNFQKILSMQYTMTWREEVLKFENWKKTNLPYLSDQSFGAHRTEEGLLTFLWLDNSLQGFSVEDGGSLYQVCFEVIGEPGTSSYFKITDRPTDIEVANLQEKVIPLKREHGTITVQ
jgi:hypothetical protein